MYGIFGVDVRSAKASLVIFEGHLSLDFALHLNLIPDHFLQDYLGIALQLYETAFADPVSGSLWRFSLAFYFALSLHINILAHVTLFILARGPRELSPTERVQGRDRALFLHSSIIPQY